MSLRRLVCALRGHQPLMYDMTATFPGIRLMTTCSRCGEVVEQEIPVRGHAPLKMIRGGKR